MRLRGGANVRAVAVRFRRGIRFDAVADRVRDVVAARMDDRGLRAVIVRATHADETVITEAFGESMAGVPATPDMHFRNGAVAISYVATALLLPFLEESTYWNPYGRSREAPSSTPTSRT